MKYPIHIALLIFVLLIFLSISVGCNRGEKNEASQQMNIAENLLDTAPDSALIILDAIKEDELYNREMKARHSLLKSMALDKRYIDTTTFDVLQPAINYYLENGSPDERLRTLYYQGRIFRNRGEDDKAMETYMYASEVKGITDSLTFAHLLVAKSVLYDRQYKLKEEAEIRLIAAPIYESLHKMRPAVRSYTNALVNNVILEEKSRADSILKVCQRLVKEYPETEEDFLPSYITYIMTYGSDSEKRELLDNYCATDSSKTMRLSRAYGYSSLGEGEKALECLKGIELEPTDSLRYFSVMKSAYESIGDFRKALDCQVNFTRHLARYDTNLFESDLLFAEKKYALEISNLMEKQKRYSIIWVSVITFLFLSLVSATLYYLFRDMKSKKAMGDMEIKTVQKEKENSELQRIAAENALERQALELENLRLEKSQLEDEMEHLGTLLEQDRKLSSEMQETIRKRLDMLNSRLAMEITNNESYAIPYKKWIESVKRDKKEFMDSTRMTFTASHPHFIRHLTEHGLDEDEINYACLYALGLRGKDVGNYIELKRHYNVSTTIRRKLGIDDNQSTLHVYLRKLLHSKLKKQRRD